MKLEELFLTREELPILHESCFEIPIHPALLDPDTQIDPSITPRAFIKATGDWY